MKHFSDLQDSLASELIDHGLTTEFWEKLYQAVKKRMTEELNIHGEVFPMNQTMNREE